MHVKGMEPAGYDPRRSRGMGLGYVVSARGACHARATFMKPELAGLIDINTTVGKGAMYVDYEDRMAILDCMVFCRFYRDLLEWEFLARIVNAAVGTDYSVEELQSRRQPHRHRDTPLQRAARHRWGVRAPAGVDHRQPYRAPRR